jgi:hypothetical protein
MTGSPRMQQSRHTPCAVRGTGLAAIVIALVWVSTGLSSPPRPKPHLRVVDAHPLTLKGAHFPAHERVRLTATATETETRTVRTKRDGSFTVQFDSVSVGRCSALAVQAVGARGDRASVKVLQSEDCAPGLGP